MDYRRFPEDDEKSWTLTQGNFEKVMDYLKDNGTHLLVGIGLGLVFFYIVMK